MGGGEWGVERGGRSVGGGEWGWREESGDGGRRAVFASHLREPAALHGLPLAQGLKRIGRAGGRVLHECHRAKAAQPQAAQPAQLVKLHL